MKSKAPEHVDLVYRKAGGMHVFASKGIIGLVHCAHSDLNVAFDKVLSALTAHVRRAYGIEAKYVCQGDFGKIASKINNSEDMLTLVVSAKRDADLAVCH